MFWHKSKSGSVRVSDVTLDDFIASALAGISSGIEKADQMLRTSNAGTIYRGNISTHSDECVKLGILKSNTENEVSTPILAVQFEVSIAVQEKKRSSSSGSAEVGTSQLSLITFDGTIKASTEQTYSTAASQKLQFTIPLSIGCTPGGSSTRQIAPELTRWPKNG